MNKNILAFAAALVGLGVVASTQSTLSIDDTATGETDAGSTSATFTVTLEGGDEGWVDTFDTDVQQPLSSYDPRWASIFGTLYVGPGKEAVIPDPRVSYARDDYSFRQSDTPTGSVEIVMDFYWDGRGAVGIEGAVQASPPHRLYEAAIWQQRIDLLYFYGPSEGNYLTIARSRTNARLTAGFFRMFYTLMRQGSEWSLNAQALDPANNYSIIEQVSATDSRLGEGTQGIGIYSEGAGGSYVTEMRVTPK
jgi:hypothetical protein